MTTRPRSTTSRPTPSRPRASAATRKPAINVVGRAASFSAQVRRGALLKADCPSREVLKHVTSRWGVLLLVVLMGGTHRFSDLRRGVGGVSEKMLSQTLKWLESDGLVRRRQLETVPPHVEYSLTPLGRQVGRRVESLADWIEASLPAIFEARSALAAESAPTGRVHRA